MCHDASNGPDWTDVRRALTGLENAHNCICTLLLLPDGRVDGTGWCVIVGAQRVSLPSGEERELITGAIKWPNSEHATLAAAVFQAVYTLDYECARRLYEQGRLWN
jgi:hypothetical protein